MIKPSFLTLFIGFKGTKLFKAFTKFKGNHSPTDFLMRKALKYSWIYSFLKEKSLE
jgi:hypothetical protein